MAEQINTGVNKSMKRRTNMVHGFIFCGILWYKTGEAGFQVCWMIMAMAMAMALSAG